MFDDKSVSFTVVWLLSYVGICWMVIGLCAFSNARNNVNISSISKKNPKKRKRKFASICLTQWLVFHRTMNSFIRFALWLLLLLVSAFLSNALCNNFRSVLPLFQFCCTNIVIVIAEMVSKIQINFFWVFQFILFYYSSYCHGVSSMLDVLWFWINCQTQ